MKKLPAQFITASLTTTILVLSLSTISFAQTTAATTDTPTTTSSNAPGNIKQATTPATIRDKANTQLQTKRQALLEKIATIKDLKKKTLIEKIDTRVGEVNQKKTSQMSQAILRMNSILVELTNKSTLAKEQGQDTSKLNTAITAAQLAVKTAETAVSTQAAKEYTLSITTENALKTTVGATVRTLQTDLRGTHATVLNAKQKVILSVAELAKLNGASVDKEASVSGESN